MYFSFKLSTPPPYLLPFMKSKLGGFENIFYSGPPRVKVADVGIILLT